MKKTVSNILFVCSIIVTVLAAIFGTLSFLGKIPCPFRKKKGPIKRSFQRDEGELRRGTA